MYQKMMIVITIAFVFCFSWLRSGIERYADRKLSLCCQFFVSGFVGLLTDLFMRRGFSPLHKRIASAFSRSHDSPSNDRFSPRARFALHGKQYFRNTATFGILPSPLHSMIHRLQTERRDSFRVRDSHPIPLFSEQACVSDCSGRAFATKAMLFSLLYVRLILRTQKDLSCPAILQTKEVSCSLYIRFDCTQKLPFYLNRKDWLVGWLVGWLQESFQLFTFL